MKWVLFLSVMVVVEPIDGPEKVGDLLDAQLIGAADYDWQCTAAGEQLVEFFEREGKGTVHVFFACLPLAGDVVARIADAQGWEDLQ